MRSLKSQVAAQSAETAAAQQHLLAASAQANAALNAYETALERSRRAQAIADAARNRLLAAQRRTAASRQRVDDYAAQAYMAGGSVGTLASTVALLNSGGPQQAVERMRLLQEVGRSDALALETVSAQEAQQRLAAQAAAGTQQTATRLLLVADRSRVHADAVVAGQRRLLRQLQARLGSTRAKLSSAQAAAAAAAAQTAAAARQVQQVGLARCQGGDLSGYPDVELPLAALCPLWGAPGNELRASAAASFNSMSRAFAAAVGTPICVTDSYRSYAEQVAVARSRPGYAAKPGTSRHGLGIAIDLCGGIETDGTAANQWMRLNAPGYGWFHPSWADAGGGGPYEPWHWEFAGA